MSRERSLSPEVPGNNLESIRKRGPKVPRPRLKACAGSEYEQVSQEQGPKVPGSLLKACMRSKEEQVLSRIGGRETEPELEIQPSEVTRNLPKCCEFDNQINLLNEAYQLVYGVSTNLLDFSNLTKIETPMKNSVLHIAAWYGNNDIVNLVIERAPKLLFTFNKNNDSALHVAARGGHISTVEKLLACYANIERHDIKMAWLEFTNNLDDPKDYCKESNMEDFLIFVQTKNVQGNTMLHEAMLCDKSISGDKIFKVCELYTAKTQYGDSLSKCCYYEYALYSTNHAKKSVLYLAVENENKDAAELIMKKCPQEDVEPEVLILKNCPQEDVKQEGLSPGVAAVMKRNVEPRGLSPVVAAIMKQNQEMLSTILENKPIWIHLMDNDQRLPLHYASSIGYLEGVTLLLGICKCCTIQRDQYGYLPIHLASHGGHVEVVKKLLEYCPDPTEMLDIYHRRNILHVAAKNGKHEVVQYILQSQVIGHRQMINQKDKNGDTPLHLAARSCQARTVFYLVNQSKERVKLDLVNQNNETALDIVSSLYEFDISSLRQQLTWTALKSAGAKQSPRPSDSNSPKTEPDQDNNQYNGGASQQNELKGKIFEPLKGMIENLTIVATLIVTASVAACLAVPGEADGKANNLRHAMFQAFIIFITISLFSSISAIIILLWTRLGLIELVIFSLKIVTPLLGTALISLSLAFITGLYTVISQLTWLANVFLVMALIFVVVLILLYMILFLPSSSSTRKSLRYISYYPFLFLAWLADKKK